VDRADDAREGVLAGKFAAALVLDEGWEDEARLPLISKTGTDYELYGQIESALASTCRELRAAASGVDPEVLAWILKTPRVEVKRAGSPGAEAGYFGILLTVLSFEMLVYMTVILYGQLIGRSVLQEKTNKTVEIMLSSVSARELLIGKILGPGIAGLLQYSFWILVTLGFAGIAEPFLGLRMPAIVSAANLGWLLVFFAPAFFLYAAAYAALGAGAGAEDEQHLQQLALPIMVCLIFPLSMVGGLVVHPDSSLSIALSFIPLTSPFVMLIRVLVSRPAWWEIGLSYTLLLMSVAAMSLLSAKIFRVGILMTGKKRKLSEILRWLSVK